MNNQMFISFLETKDGINGSLNLEGLMDINGDPEEIIVKASALYQKAIYKIRIILEEREKLFKNHMRIPARLIWEIGDEIFRLTNDLAKLGLVIDNTYAHLIRDLKVKRKWLEKVVIFRRYISDIAIIPEDITWGFFEKGTKQKVQALIKK